MHDLKNNISKTYEEIQQEKANTEQQIQNANQEQSNEDK